VGAAYSYYDGATWNIVALLGDGMETDGWHWFNVAFPEEAMSTMDSEIVFFRHGGSQCADIDEAIVLSLPVSTGSTTLLATHFDEGSIEPFAEDPVGAGDVDVITESGNTFAILDDNEGTSMWASVSTSGVGPMPAEILFLRWVWWWGPIPPGPDDYVVAECSVDGGSSWEQIAAVGSENAFGTPQTMGALLLPRAYEQPDFRVRFHAPTTASNSPEEGIGLGNVSLTVEHVYLYDVFSAFTDQGDGTYRATVVGPERSERSIMCFWACGEVELQTGWLTLTM
jgi:hypothetical protein